MGQGPRQPVDPHDHQRIALADPLQHAGQQRPRAITARGLLFMNPGAACGFQGKGRGRLRRALGPDGGGAWRAAVQRNLTWMETRGLIREVTGQSRFRMWRAAV